MANKILLGRESYKINRQLGYGGAGGAGASYALALPARVAGLLYDRDVRFSVELTKDGILYRPISLSDIEAFLPAWAQESE